MNKMKKTTILILIITTIIGTTACNKKTTKEETTITATVEETKTVETLNWNETNQDLYIETSGTVENSQPVNIIPETAGKIIAINKKEGETVKKGEVIAIIGDSLNTEIQDIQIKTATKSTNNLIDTFNLTAESADNQIFASELGIKSAKLAYQNAIRNKETYEDSYETQYDNAKLGIEIAKEGYYTLKDVRTKIEDAFIEANQKLEDLNNKLRKTNLPEQEKIALLQQKAELEKSITELQNSITTAKANEKQTKLKWEQAKNSLKSLEITKDTQLNTLNLGIKSANIQYQNALNQNETAEIAKQLQTNQVKAQIIQNEGNKEIQEATAKKRYIRSPINGTINKIFVKENNMASNQTPFAQIENKENTIIKTSLSPKEAKLIRKTTPIIIEIEGNKIEGFISNYTPNLNPQTGNYDIEITPMPPISTPTGETATIKFKPSSKNIFIPLNSIYIDDEKTYVKTINQQNRIEYNHIETGEIIGDKIEITQGLNGTEKIITSVNIFTKEGEKVTTS